MYWRDGKENGYHYVCKLYILPSTIGGHIGVYSGNGKENGYHYVCKLYIITIYTIGGHRGV